MSILQLVGYDPTKKIHEQITKNTWCQGTLGEFDDDNTYNLVSCCAIGWLNQKYPTLDERIPIQSRLEEKINQQLTDWNDTPGRTVDDVRALFKEHDI